MRKNIPVFIVFMLAIGSPGVPGVIYLSSVYFGADDNRLHAVDAETGERRWAFEFGPGGEQSSPAVVDDRLFIGVMDGSVHTALS